MPEHSIAMAASSGLPPAPPPLTQGTSLFLDFDGTLVDIAEQPDQVTIPRGLAELLFATSARLNGRLALVSGRSIAQLDAIFARDLQPLAISGSHGCEFRWQSHHIHPDRPVAAIDYAARKFDDFAFGHPGTLVEIKTYGVALHYRGDPACAGYAQSLAQHLAEKTGLVVENGKMVVELRHGGCDKGMAVRHLIACAPMAGGRPVYLGDDLTDEAAFAAVNALDGVSVLVGPARVTKARCHLPDPAAVLSWLSRGAA